MNDTVKKVYTLKGTCKKCGDDFTYLRPNSLIGTPRTICDKCKRSLLRSRIVSEE